MYNSGRGQRLFAFVLVALLTFGYSVAFGQVQTGDILGTVTDSSGASVPGTVVTVTSTDTGSVRTVQTDAQGRYDVSDLDTGNYSVQTSMQGFASQTQKGVVLAVGQKAVIDFKLQVGAVTQEVTTSASVAPQVNTTTSEVGAVVNERQVSNLPLNGRNFEQLFALVPGIQQITALTAGGGDLEGSTVKFSVAGSRTNGQTILLDGVEIKGFWGQSAGSQVLSTSLGIDGIAEFQTATGNFNSQYSGLSVMNEVTRSGTNDLHGSAYGFFRDSALDARNYFDPVSGPPAAQYNQFGGALGGPIKKNKTFVFGNYEGLRATITAYDTQTVPDHNAHLGYLPCASAPNYPCNASGLANVGVNPAIAPYLALYPDYSSGPAGAITGLTSGAVVASPGTVRAVLTGADQEIENFYAVKVDHQISTKNNLAFRYVMDQATEKNPWPGTGSQTSVPVLLNVESLPEKNQYGTLQDRHIFSDHLINVASISAVLAHEKVVDTYNQPNATNIVSMMSWVGGQTPQRPAGALGISGLSSLQPISSYNALKLDENTFTEQDEVDWIHGGHSFKFGGVVARIECNCGWQSGAGGTYTFAASTVGGAPYSPLESFLTANPGPNGTFSSRYPTLTDWLHGSRETTVSGFFQDDWRVRKNLTLNLGIRDDYVTNPSDSTNKIYTILDPAGGGPLTHVPHIYQGNPSTRNIDPRVGLAWDVFGDQKTSLRSGFGLYHSLIYPREYTDMLSQTYPDATFSQFNATFPNPFVGGWASAPPSTFATGGGATAGNLVSPYSTTPYNMEYNLTLERQLPKGLTTSLGYVGSAGVHLTLNIDTNDTLPTSILSNGLQYRATMNNPVPDANFGGIVMMTPNGNSHYNAVVATVTRHVGRGIQLQSSYTFASCIDWGSSAHPEGGGGWDVGNDTPMHITPALPSWYNKGPCSFSVRSSWIGNAVIPLPFRGNQLKEGWQIGLITSAKDGNPVTPLVGFDRANLNSHYSSDAALERPNPNPSFTGPLIEGNPTHWFNPNAFAVQPIGYIGTVSRDTIPGPNIVDTDISLIKDTRIPKFGESNAVQVRADVFNIFNHTNFSLPAVSLFSGPTTVNPSAAEITVTATPSRQAQLSVRYLF
jgi:hypothetical protein